MTSLREAFENPEIAQSNFYSAQQIRYQQVEPNRFLPKDLDPMIAQTSASNLLLNFDKYDPYTEKTTNQFSLAGISELLRGTSETTNEEAYCRGLTGASALNTYRNDMESADQLRNPIRCGWRYKKSPGGGAPIVSQGALGTVNGPLNTSVDRLGDGVQWYWDLRKAYNQHAQDFVATLPASSSGLASAQNAQNGAFSNTAYCGQTSSYIFVDSAGRPMPGYACAADTIITDPTKFPQVSQNATTSVIATNASVLQSCQQPGANSYLTRECLLQAVSNNGCSSSGTLYQALQSASPSDTRYDRYLTNQNAFTIYQSKQGDNRITEDLFDKEKGSWDMATQAIQKLHTTAQTATDPLLRVAAQDLCSSAGTFDTYDFCSEITDSTSINGVDLSCIQGYWQEKNGKPAGLAYPTSKQFHASLGTISTWGDYKRAVNLLKEKTGSSNGVEQRTAVDNFFGVRTKTEPFTPLNLEDVDMQFRLGSQPLVFWIDAKDASTFAIDSSNRVRDWKDKSIPTASTPALATQNNVSNRPIYRRDAFPGVDFDGASNFMELPSRISTNILGNFMMFVVEKRKSGKNDNFFMGGSVGGTNRNLVLGYRNSTVATMAFLNNDLDTQVSAFAQGLEPVRIWGFEKTSTGKNIYLNGVLISTNNQASNLTSWVNATLGRYMNQYYNGTLYEVLLYTPGVGSNEKRQKVEGYLAWKWGLTTSLPDNHPYRTRTP